MQPKINATPQVAQKNNSSFVLRRRRQCDISFAENLDKKIQDEIV